MQRFFPDFESLDRFTLSLHCLDGKLQCPHCAKCRHLISHGVIYKQRSIKKREPVGKRMFCSNRYQHTGCGRTVQLYVAEVVPAMQYAVAIVYAFLSALLSGASASVAYQNATGKSDTRQAWRWLHKLDNQLSEFRTFVHARTEHVTKAFDKRCRRLQLLLPTLQALFSVLPSNPCVHYQLRRQIPLL